MTSSETVRIENVVLRCGRTAVILFDPARFGAPGGKFPPHGASGAGHVEFVVPDADLPAWRARLARHGVLVEAEVEWLEGGRPLYVRDPAGNSVELAPPAIWRGLGFLAAVPG